MHAVETAGFFNCPNKITRKKSCNETTLKQLQQWKIGLHAFNLESERYIMSITNYEQLCVTKHLQASRQPPPPKNDILLMSRNEVKTLNLLNLIQ
jgi:hypothetical protein